ncbi:MAG: hypothetical protein ABI455_02400 [Candidatus Dormiibacterota bacterium]
MPATVPGFEDDAGVMLPTINRITFGSSTVQIVTEPPEQPSELPLVVEGSDDLVATLVTPDIVGIPTDDIALDTIVIGVDGRHDGKCASRRPRARPAWRTPASANHP